MAELEQILGSIAGELKGINGRLDKVNGNIGKLWDRANDNREAIATIEATCTANHKEDDNPENRRGIHLTFKQFITLLGTIAVIAVGGAITAWRSGG